MLDAQSKVDINSTVAALTTKTVAALQAEQERVGIKSRTGRLKKITIKYADDDGLISRISFKFQKYGVYQEKGAGRGQGGLKGSQWLNKEGQVIKTNPRSFGRMNTGNRHAKEWFNPVIENYVDQLAEHVANDFVNLSFKNLRIK